MDYYIIWLIVMVICLVVEALTMGLTTIWFAVGAFVAMLLSLMGVPISIQIVVFLVISITCLIFLYPIVKNKLKLGKEKTNYEAMLNKVGLVVEEIDNVKSTGQVKVEGQIWTARSLDDYIIETGKLVTINEVRGVKLIVTQNK